MELFEVKVKESFINEKGQAKKRNAVLLIKDIETYTEAEKHLAEIIGQYDLITEVVGANIKKVKVSIPPQVDFGMKHHYMVETEMEALDGGTPVKDVMLLSGDNPSNVNDAAPMFANESVPSSVSVTKISEYDMAFYSCVDSGSGKRVVFTDKDKIDSEAGDKEVF